MLMIFLRRNKGTEEKINEANLRKEEMRQARERKVRKMHYSHRKWQDEVRNTKLGRLVWL